MKPQPRRAREGRVNPNGIPCLYLADTKETAMAEMRAWLGTPITVSQFELVRDISIVDFSGSYVRSLTAYASPNSMMKPWKSSSGVPCAAHSSNP